MRAIKVSVIIVTYHDTPYLLNCLTTLNNLSISHEIIVVDNYSDTSLKEKLRKYTAVEYLKSPGNIGYGSGCNLGASVASGNYLFILNPDTLVYPGCLESLVKFLEDNPRVGMVAPLLLDEKRQVYELQGTGRLTPMMGILTLSFLNKLLLKTPLLNKFWLKDWDKKTSRQVDIVPGTAFLTRANLFNQIGGFDPKIFIYFEEHDICLRIKQLGWEIYIEPKAKVVHFWGKSTPNHALNRARMATSRIYYFRKHFGFLSMLMVETFAQINARSIILTLVLAVAIFLRIWHLSRRIVYFPDMGWFFDSARMALVTGRLPLLGITASITWLHQGPLWTYFLLLPTALSIPPVAFTIVCGILTIILVHEMLGWPTALMMAVLPFAVTTSQTAYHTSLIPLFFFIALASSIRRRSLLTGLFVGFLYQLHLLTFIYWPLWLYLAYRHKLSLGAWSLGFALGILPFLLAGPIQTVGIFLWLAKGLLTGFSVSSGISNAYWVVLLPGIILLLGKMIKSIYAHWSSFSQK